MAEAALGGNDEEGDKSDGADDVRGIQRESLEDGMHGVDTEDTLGDLVIRVDGQVTTEDDEVAELRACRHDRQEQRPE